MPKKKRKLTGMPTEEAIRRLFPKKVIEKAKEIVHEKDRPEDEEPEPQKPPSTKNIGPE